MSREQFDAVSEPGPPVACTEEHTAQTFKITQVPPPLTEQGARPSQEELKALTTRLCDVASLQTYLGAGERDATTGLAIAAYAPSRDDWERGARAFRCDVLLVAKDGSPRATTLNLRGALAGPHSAVLRLCYRQEPDGGGLANEVRLGGDSGPGDGWLSDDGVDVPCSEPHTAEDISAWFNLDASVATPAARTTRCLPYALQFLGTGSLPAGIMLRPIIRTVDNARTVRCAVAPVQSNPAQANPAQANPSTTTGTLAPAGGRKHG